MNSYFDQQWDQQLAGRPQALAAFTSLTPAASASLNAFPVIVENIITVFPMSIIAPFFSADTSALDSTAQMRGVKLCKGVVFAESPHKALNLKALRAQD